MEEKSLIRLIVMDMDGTLLDPAQRITQGSLTALREAQARGIRLAICSGRLFGDIAMLLEEAGLSDCAILAGNGTFCAANPAEDAFANRCLTDDTLMEAVRILKREHFPFGCFAQNRLVIFEGDFPVDVEFWSAQAAGRFAPQYLYGDSGLAAVRPSGVNKLLCMAQDEDALERARRDLCALPGMDVTSSWHMNLELMPAGASKGAAVAALARELGLDASQVMAIGDYDNDESMLTWAGLGVAMGNASPRAKKAADRQTLRNDQDGVAWAVRRYALGCEAEEAQADAADKDRVAALTRREAGA